MKIDLGSKSPSPGCAPVSCCNESGERTHYPSLYLSGSKKLDLPDEGTAVITFKKVSSGMDERDGQEPHYRCELEVQSIEVKGGSSKDDAPMGVSVGAALKEAMRKKMKKGEYEDGEE